MSSKQSYRSALHKFYSMRHFDNSTKINGEDIALCYYCSAIAYERDHVPPLIFVFKEIAASNYDVLTKFDLVIVPACKPCNRRLAARQLLTLKSRRRYIRKGVIAPYRSGFRNFIDGILDESLEKKFDRLLRKVRAKMKAQHRKVTSVQ